MPKNLTLAAILLTIGVAAAQTTKPKAQSNLDFWLNQATSAPATRPVTATGAAGVNPFDRKGSFRRADAVPGVLELSDNRQIPGWIYTTVEKPLIAFVDIEKRWRRLPLIVALSISAEVVEEKITLRWRWKAMGEPERVYTGKSYPTRRLKWKFRLIDGSEIVAAIKGQPIWVELNGRKHGPFVLHERFKGADGQKLDDLIYVKRIVLSRKMMDKVVTEQKKAATSRATNK